MGNAVENSIDINAVYNIIRLSNLLFASKKRHSIFIVSEDSPVNGAADSQTLANVRRILHLCQK